MINVCQIQGLITIQKKLPSTIAPINCAAGAAPAAVKPVWAKGVKIALAMSDHTGHKIIERAIQISSAAKPFPSELLKARFVVYSGIYNQSPLYLNLIS
jgi:hypothetical protein